MNEIGIKAENASVAGLGLSNVEMAYWNLHPSELIEDCIIRGEGFLTNVGALAIDTGEFTGRSPKDKFVVYDENTKDSVWWGDVNNRFESMFERMKQLSRMESKNEDDGDDGDDSGFPSIPRFLGHQTNQ